MIILIDNGHGNNTPGKRSPDERLMEWKWNREIAADVVPTLQSLGYDARLLVTEDNDILLGERVRRVNYICSKYGTENVILISIHGNACGHGEWMEGTGWECYTTRGKTKSDTLAECLYKRAEKNFKGKKIRKDLKDGDSDKEADFYIIAKSKCPAVLTENFFYDNRNDIEYMLSEEGRHMIVRTHVEGIIDYINLQM